jgi:bacteriorhodopsin
MPFEHARSLSSSDSEEAFELGSKISQIFSGCAFTALACYLVFSNATRLSFIHRASIEKRLAVCCQLSLVVATISAFFNFFQLSELDNFALTGQRQFTVDVSRPIEWILTCPLMQLSLVIMGGPRIPESRRVIMPVSSAIVLCFGTSTLFLDVPYTYICFGCGFCIHLCAMYFNRLQILEHSRGVEGLLSGDSEFRRATLILMLTWIPFPMWFFLSPEGVGLVDNIVIIQMGWAFLNIISKFTLIFYLQRIKDNYNIRVKMKRSMQQNKSGAGFHTSEKRLYDDSMPESSSELCALVLETMSFLGMAQNADRMLKLLMQAKISSLDQIEHLDKKDCDEKQLPHDLICAIQSRYKVWALEMVDDAELGLEAGEKFYNIGEIVPSRLASNVGDPESGDGDTAFPMSVNGISIIGTSPRGDSRHTSKNFGKMFAFEQGSEVLKETLMETMTQVMEQFENKLWEKVEYALEGTGRKVMEHMDKRVEGIGKHVADCDTTMRFGLQDVSKSMERSQAVLESKVEYVFAARKKEQCEEMQASVKAQFEEFSQTTTKTAAQFETKIMTTMASQFESIEADVKRSCASLNDLQEMYQAGVGKLGSALTKLTEDCAHEVIQESKAAAYTLQAKIAILEESQKKTNTEHEARISSKMQQFETVVSDKVEKVRDAIRSTPPTFPSLPLIPDNCNMGNFSEKSSSGDADAAGRTLDALRSLENNLAEMIRQGRTEYSKQLELGLGVFGMGLRSQLDSMQHAEAGLLKETEAKLEVKLDRLHEQGRKQTDKIITQLTLQQASGLQGPISSSFTKSHHGGQSVGSSRRHSNWNDD